eukprot:Opistho-1_new@81298
MAGSVSTRAPWPRRPGGGFGPGVTCGTMTDRLWAAPGQAFRLPLQDITTMASVNKVILVGNCGRDPEIRYLPSGQAVANVSVATSSRRKDKNSGEMIEDPCTLR